MRVGVRAVLRLWFVCLVAAGIPSLAQSVTVSVATLAFGKQVEGTASAVKQVTLKNGQTTAITISSIATNLSDYTQTNTCPVSPAALAAGKTCVISVTFKPTALGTRSATLTVTDTGKTSPQTVSLSGTGIASVVVSTASIAFGNQLIANKSAASKVTLTNNQTTALTISSISTTLADYTYTTTCPTGSKTLAAGANCTVSVFFEPTVAGVRNGTLTITDNANISPTVSLSGTGIYPAVASPGSLTFASQALDTSSAPQTVTLTNNKAGTITITKIASSLADFVVSTNCPLSPSTLAGGASCTASVTFNPEAQGSRSGTLKFTDGTSNSPQTVDLTGTGSAPNLVSIAVSPATASILAGSTQQFTATGTYTDGSSKNLSATASWTSSVPGIAGVSGAGLASGLAAGGATITATSGSISGSATLTVMPTLVSIAITPANASFARGTTQALHATGTYADGSTQDLTASATWSTANSGIATVSNQGVASSVALGSTSVTATSGSISGSTTLTVTPATLVSIAITPAIPTIPLGTTQQFAATGTFTDGSTQNLTSTVQWSSDAGTTASFNTASSPGLATGVGTGTANIFATSGSVRATTTLTVTPAALVSIAVAPQNPTIALGTTQQFTATGTYTDGSTQDLTATATWSSDTPAAANVNAAGLATSAATGTANISATSGSVSGVSTLTVTPAQLVSIVINPATASVPAGVPQSFTATGTYTDGTTQDLTQTGHWSSSDASVATISDSAGTYGVATTLKAGPTTIGITSGSVSASASLTVVPAILVSIAINPTAPTIPLGTGQQFAASGTYTDSSSQDVTTAVTWATSDATVATISNDTGSNGMAMSSGTGTANITATLGSVSNSTSITVATAALVAIAITPANPSIPLGTTQQFIATGTYTDKSTQDLTATVTWASDTPGVTTIGATGLAAGVGMGVANVSATLGTIQSSTSIAVGPPVLVSIAISPGATSVAAGQTQQFSALGTYSNGAAQDLTTQVVWASTSAAGINNSGLATGLAQGSASITATLGTIVASATLNVTPPILVSMSVSPSGATIPDGTTQQFTAIGTYSDGSTQDLTASAGWTSSATGIAAIGASGLATGASVGTATITATSNSISNSATLAVGQPVLVSIAITPANSSLALGTSQQLAATGTYTDGSTQDLTATVTWSAMNSAIASVSSQGLAGSVAVGSTSISATSGSITGSTLINVTPAALVSIAVTPAIPSIPSGTTLQFAATGTFTDGSVQDVTQTVQWSSDTASVAAFNAAANQNGLASSVGTGSATITATSGSVSGSTTLTVTAAVLVSIAVTPANPSIALGTTQQFTATGTFTDGSTQDLTSTATWSSDTPAIATINASGLATGGGEGAANISATSGSVTGTSALNVTAAQLISITINPPSAAVPLGMTQQFTATGTYTDSTTQDVTQSAHWSSDNAPVSTISNATGSAGLANTFAVGSTNIGVTSGSVTATATLTVNAATLVSIAINPSMPVVPLGTNQQFTATGTYTDGSTQDITAISTWSTSSADVMTVSNAAGSAGLGASSGAGTATISVTSGAISQATVVTVSQAALSNIAITPAGTSIAQGYTLQFTATGTYTDASTQDITQSVSWSSSSAGVASISAAGFATTIYAGMTSISATSGSIVGSTTLTVTVPVPVSLVIGPANPSIYINAQQQFAATLYYSDGSSMDVTNTVVWTSTGVATINSAGLASAATAGLSTIQANWGSAILATTMLTVMPPSVSVTPANVTIAINGTEQFSAAVAGSSNQSVTWAVDGIAGGNSSLGTISAAGLYVAPPMIGTHTISATAQANSASIGKSMITVGAIWPVASTFFGMHAHYATSPVPSSMEGVGRIWDSNAAQWPNLNTANGTFVWTNLDAVLASYKNAGINDILYTLWRVPKWASSNPTDTTCDDASIGANWTGACDLPTDINADGTGTNLTWRNWVQNVAQHVNDPTYLQTHAKVKYWEACNECYRSPTLNPGYGGGTALVAYRGTYAQLVRLMQDARCIIVGNPNDAITALQTTCGQSGYPVTGIDPAAQMVMPSTNPITGTKSLPYPQVMQNLLYCTCSKNSCSASTTGCPTGSAGSAAVDIISVHAYPSGYAPEQIPAEMAIVRTYLNATDLAKPFWSDEGGWGQTSTATSIKDGDPDLEAAFVARFDVMMWASGVGRTYWYEWDNSTNGTQWSPTSVTGCTTPYTSGYICSSGIAAQQVHNWLLGATMGSCASSGTEWSCSLTLANGSNGLILWDTSQTCSNGVCGTVQYATPAGFNTYMDLAGNAHGLGATVPAGIKPILLFTQ